MDLTLLIGTSGMLILLIAFILDLMDKLDDDTIASNALNAIGAGILIYYAYQLKSYPFLVLESVWMLSAAYKGFKISGKS